MTTAVVQASGDSPATSRPRRVAVMPAYNEEATIIGVLERLEPLADELIIVDDGSTDSTRQLTLEWAANRPSVRVICFNQNRGMSAAYYRAFQELMRRQEAGLLDADDLVLTVDADGQHDPDDVDALVTYFQTNRLDALIARRDLEKYTLYKKIGNFLMSLWASIWAGQRLYDVESGYRIFRVGGLLSALRFYKGYRYSETVEVAVILARIGYRVDNSYLVPVPLFRSRTRIKDVLIDLAAIPAAAWRVAALRHKPAAFSRRAAILLPLLAPILLVLLAASVLSHRLYLATDSMQHYSHVWYVSTQLFHHARLPLHISSLENGQAMTFPYGFAPYILGAILRLALGDWAVTLLMVLGFLALTAAAMLARPGMRDPWLLLLFVLNPFFIDSLLAFQFASVWSGVFFFLFIWTFEKRRLVAATAFAWLTIATHPIMGIFGLGGYAAYLTWRNRDRLPAMLGTSAVGGLAALPFLWMTLQTPSIAEHSLPGLALSLLDTMARRGIILFLPLALTVFAPWIRRNYPRVLQVAVLLLVVGFVYSAGIVKFGNLNMGTYSGVFASPHAIYAGFFRSPQFHANATYRVMEPTDREDGVYSFMQQGAIVGHEFFSESFLRRSFSPAQFTCLVNAKGLDYDILESSYNRDYGTNEGVLLQQLVSNGSVSIAYADPARRFTVYDVRGLRNGKPVQISDCGL